MTDLEFRRSLLRLAQQMAWLEQIAYREWTPSKPEGTSHSMAQAPLAVDATAWDMLQACIQVIDDVWSESGHIGFDQWRTLVASMCQDSDYFAQRSRADLWVQVMDKMSDKAQRITASASGLDPQGVLVITPSQLADKLAAEYAISCSVTNVKNWLRRGVMEAKRLGDGYWAVAVSSVRAFASTRKRE